MTAARTAQGRSDQALTALLEATAPDLLRYLVRRVLPREDAADVLNETLLVAWRRRTDCPGDDEAARMWLFGIARRTLATHRRSRGRATGLTQRLREELGSPTTALTAGYPGDDASERAREVREAIVALPARQRELVRLVHWDGFSLTDAAQVAGMRASTARTHYQRARRALADVLGEPADDGGSAPEVASPEREAGALTVV